MLGSLALFRRPLDFLKESGWNRHAWVARIGANRASPGPLWIALPTALYYLRVVVWSDTLGLAWFSGLA